MDTLSGQFGSFGLGDEVEDYPIDSDDTGRELPPSPIGQDERRMQVRAYNHWASQLAERNFPDIEDLSPGDLPDFGPYSVLLDFTNGIEDPSIRFLGDMLAQECGAENGYGKLSDVPSRSLLSRITDHYMQILANQAPIGFEAEFVNQRGATILYRGILLPYSSDDDTIDFIYGVINWKELADQLTSDELLLEIDQAIAVDGDDLAHEIAANSALPTPHAPVHGWADGPADADTDSGAAASTHSLPMPSFGIEPAEYADNDDGPIPNYEHKGGNLYDAIEASDDDGPDDNRFASLLSLGGIAAEDEEPLDEDTFDIQDTSDSADSWSESENATDPLSSLRPRPLTKTPLDLSVMTNVAPDGRSGMETDYTSIKSESGFAGSDDASLFDCLAEARELAQTARNSEDRSRGALYAAVGRAYDVSLAAAEAPDDFADILADSGLTMQDRSPMTPVVKLVFGADYDKTRITEYAAVLSHAQRLGVARGALARFLSDAEGGLKGVVQAERALRRSEQGEPEKRETPREALARKLRAIAPLGFEDIVEDGPEFSLVMIRRDGDGNIVVLGEIADDIGMIEKAGRKLVA
ncbi:MAG: PAS domain-containing protein [Tsuneonella suprasediminis]|uniref:PAS domain-containing protein n=1 Tax=Tsuneonella suprasediminis TaxID=2306996 RepID=A0A419R422_9SPHN|nr:hypothetical protein [Tsuneonella suprasediminis]RJX69285.1 hypothetical protein D6858_05300 [Tsuneonella suprasediminis]UBS33960.1 hypothetical protein LBX01_04885 [Altererythrobacter sp. N1]